MRLVKKKKSLRSSKHWGDCEQMTYNIGNKLWKVVPVISFCSWVYIKLWLLHLMHQECLINIWSLKIYPFRFLLQFLKLIHSQSRSCHYRAKYTPLVSTWGCHSWTDIPSCGHVKGTYHVVNNQYNGTIAELTDLAILYCAKIIPPISCM